MQNSPLLNDERASNSLDQRFKQSISDLLAPVPDLSLSEWAEEYRFLPSKAAFSGKWSNSTTPYAVGIMDAITNPRIREIVCMMPAQVCKTEVLLNTIGYHVHLAPCEMLLVQPKIEAAQKFSTERIAPLFQTTPVLRALYNSRDPMESKSFRGGTLNLVGANSPADLSSRAVKLLMMDEVDRYELSAGDEGDPVQLAKRRTTTFRDYKVVLVSSPGVKHSSRIEPAYLASDQRKWVVPCPHCHESQELLFGGKESAYGLKWDDGNPDSAYYLCAHCACVIEYRDNTWLQARGEWIITNPTSTIAGFWMTALNSLFPGSSWANIARDFLSAQALAKAGNIEVLKQFTNTVLAETWEEKGQAVDELALAARKEMYDGEIPSGVVALTMGVDVQKDRLEWAVWGFGKGEESWLIATDMILHPPMSDTAWDTLAHVIESDFTTGNGVRSRVAAVAIDHGYAGHEGTYKERVERFSLEWNTRKNKSTTVIAVKGVEGRDSAILHRPTQSRNGEFKPYTVSVASAKDLIFERFKPEMSPGPGYIHLPVWLDDERIKQFTAEERRISKKNGHTIAVYHKCRARNEQLDLLVYAMAAMRLYGTKDLRNLDRASPLSNRARPIQPDQEASTPTPLPVQTSPKPPIKRKKGVQIYGSNTGFQSRNPFGR